ncbi:MAG: hypothetical protein NZ529_02260 [Cytophagaceae bacterium]|nr:hypothetical protein [Cytophagaceae bacterium]MDW8455592.1 hypothetical protein [Cytophagaceae bacterium]
MLEYVKLILQKVSFDEYLFEKELRKNMKDLLRDELLELKKWCYENFSDTYLTILNQCFN